MTIRSGLMATLTLGLCYALIGCTTDPRVTGGDQGSTADLGTPDGHLESDALSCVPMPSCNWCGGTTVTDGQGCFVGYECANGVDPCSTPPCKPGSCKSTEECGKDGLCWPRKSTDGGMPTPDSFVCPPMPSCNWCGGTTHTDKNGCAVGYTCANGVDPCSTSPCSQTAPTGCKSTEFCGKDMLCWPATPKTFTCGSKQCVTATQYCQQQWPGACGGSPVPAGGCGPGCKETACGNGQKVCLCSSQSCEPLPGGCSDCNCLKLPANCNCKAFVGSGIYVECMGI